MDFNPDCNLCEREAINSSGLCAKHLKESQHYRAIVGKPIYAGKKIPDVRKEAKHQHKFVGYGAPPVDGGAFDDLPDKGGAK
jgi:hypothetical protein